jgi:hypothetical protein
MIATFCVATGSIVGLYLYYKHKVRSCVCAMPSIVTPPYFLIDRILIANVEPLKGKNIVVGVTGQHDPQNVLSHQGIRIADGSIQKLLSASKTQNGLSYDFEDNTKLVFMKKNEGIVYSLQSFEHAIVGVMDPILISNYKTIGLNSEELDMIHELK